MACIDMLYYGKVSVTLCVSFIQEQAHTSITVRDMPPRRMGTRGRPRAVEAQAANDDQPQLATATQIVELRQVVQQQAK